MKRRSLRNVPDHEVRRGLYAGIASGHVNTADVLLHIAEFEARKLYAAEGYSSMFAYCVGPLHFSDDEAYKRIQAVRAAQEFPAIFDAIAEGRLHLTAIVRLGPHLTPENADELLAAATHKTKAEIELLLAERFPKSDLPTLVRALAPAAVNEVDVPAQPAPPVTQVVAASATQLVPEPVPAGHLVRPASMTPPTPPAKVTPLSPRRFGLQLTVCQATHDKLRHAQNLLGHQIPNGDIAQVIDRALDALIERLEKQKFATTSRPQSTPRPAKPGTRHIPAHVKRAVRTRDGDRCAFVSESGLRCQARSRLEFHHVKDFARGGEATIEGIQLRCRAHNQFEAERTYGTAFMGHKREEARLARQRAADCASEHAPGGAGSHSPTP